MNEYFRLLKKVFKNIMGFKVKSLPNAALLSLLILTIIHRLTQLLLRQMMCQLSVHSPEIQLSVFTWNPISTVHTVNKNSFGPMHNFEQRTVHLN